VNLIGEHIDYNGLPVLPMALDREIVLRFEPRSDGRVILRNADPRFSGIDFTASDHIEPEPAGAWGNYPRAAAQILWRETGALRGIEGELTSTVPVAAGLSSSSALVVAVALALLDATGREVAPKHLMSMLARGERYVGLQGGGMDQAISLGGRRGHAMRIDFRPELELTPIPIPDDWRIVVASSLNEAAKAAGARDAYNARVVECRQALELVAARGLGIDRPDDYAGLIGKLPPAALLDAARPVLPQLLFRRFRHVVTEADRVRLAEQALRERDLTGFGRLLHESHLSLRNDYEVSGPELDQLVEIAMKAGATGARLTGAGFGGCIIAATDTATAPIVMAELEKQFFRPRAVAALEEVLFSVVPSDGARVSSPSTRISAH
jgi:galactokinase